MITSAPISQNNNRNMPRPQAVNPDETGLIRFLRSVRNIFFPTWSSLEQWKIESGIQEVSWAIQCDHEQRRLAFQDVVFANRDAFRALLIFGCIISEKPTTNTQAIEAKLKSVRDMAAYIRRERLARYLDDLLAGLRYGDVSVECGTRVWVFVELEWAMPATDSRAPEKYDALFEDSLLFTQIKRLLEDEDAA